jgi:hypothetical protein
MLQQTIVRRNAAAKASLVTAAPASGMGDGLENNLADLNPVRQLLAPAPGQSWMLSTFSLPGAGFARQIW